MLRLYPKLAWQNLRKNYQVTVPYLLSGSGIIMMFYMICALAVGAENSEFYGARTTATVLGLGIYIVALFGAIFLFYTNSFLMKRRKKELGLYNILGMEKRHIAGVILTETLMTAAICLAAGLALGAAFSRVFFLILEKLLGMSGIIPFIIPLRAIFNAVLLFGCIFLATALYNILQVRLSKPIELLHGGEIGEKEPKAHWLLAVLGLGLLGAGYYMALTITNPIDALLMFFVAVILVILGTYLLFIVGITAMLKLLKKNKGFYYKTRHFTTVSGMLYRMKQNAAGLASICILFTCLLVTVSTTFALYAGVGDVVERRCPQDFEYTLTSSFPDDAASFREGAAQACANHGMEMENVMECRLWQFAGSRVEDAIHINDGTASSTYASIELFRLEDYNQYCGESLSMAADEALVFDPAGKYPFDTLTIFGRTYRVTKIEPPGGQFVEDTSYLMGYEQYAIVLNDPELIQGSQLVYDTGDGDPSYFEITYLLRFDIPGHDPETALAIYQDFGQWITGTIQQLRSEHEGASGGMGYTQRCQAELRESFNSLYGGVFFLGLFMGAVFLLGTTLIIYYKQVSEGYEDARRFKIMQDVGMSHQEVKQSIHSQVLQVFFLPLLIAILHLCFAYPMLQKILALMGVMNVGLTLLSMLGSVVVFSVVYLLIYLRTARTYYKIVESGSGSKTRGAHFQ